LAKNNSSSPQFLSGMLNNIDDLPFVNERNATLLLAAMHIAGAIGLSIESTRALFQLLTPFNLVATAAILLHFEQHKEKRLFLFILVTFVLGYGFEVIGVKTGLIFGEYEYGKTLGYKVLDVPLVIGINWVILTYITRGVAQKFVESDLAIVIVASLLMVILDVFIEPVAIRFDFWSWANTHVPFQNYVGWFMLSAIIQFIGIKIFPTLNNRLNTSLLIIQFVFFVTLNLM
jgi:putative membrane protein